MDVRIRDGTPDDAPALAPLLVEVNDLHAAAHPEVFRRAPADEATVAYLRALIAQDQSRTFVAERAGAPIGYLWARLLEAPPLPILTPRRYAEIDTLVVAASSRRLGVGHALMEAAHSWAAAHGIDRVHLTVYALNRSAIRFYERLGYVTVRCAMWCSLSRTPQARDSHPSAETDRRDARATPDLPAPNVTIQPARPADAEQILKLQYLCYQPEAARYDDWTLPPLTQSLPDLLADFATHRILAARLGDEIVGSVRAHLNAGTCTIGRLIVHPRLQGRGLGTRLLRAIERHHPTAHRFELFTGARSEGNLRLYHRLGYTEFRRETISPQIELVYLEKRQTNPSPAPETDAQHRGATGPSPL